jgi:hypothetical protein
MCSFSCPAKPTTTRCRHPMRSTSWYATHVPPGGTAATALATVGSTHTKCEYSFSPRSFIDGAFSAPTFHSTQSGKLALVSLSWLLCAVHCAVTAAHESRVRA